MSPRKISLLQLSKIKGIWELKSALTSDMEMKKFEVCPDYFLPCFSPVFLQYDVRNGSVNHERV